MKILSFPSQKIYQKDLSCIFYFIFFYAKILLNPVYYFIFYFIFYSLDLKLDTLCNTTCYCVQQVKSYNFQNVAVPLHLKKKKKSLKLQLFPIHFRCSLPLCCFLKHETGKSLPSLIRFVHEWKMADLIYMDHFQAIATRQRPPFNCLKSYLVAPSPTAHSGDAHRTGERERTEQLFSTVCSAGFHYRGREAPGKDLRQAV